MFEFPFQGAVMKEIQFLVSGFRLNVTVKPIFQSLLNFIFLLGITTTASSSPHGDNIFQRAQPGSDKIKKDSACIFTSKFRPDISVFFAHMKQFDTQKDYGPRFLLVKKNTNKSILLDKSRGMREDHLDPSVFESKDSIVILANISGNHNSYGIAVYETKNDKFNSLGTLNVSKPSGAYTVNPIPDAVVKSNKGRLVIEFHTDLKFDPTEYYNKKWISKLGWVKKRINNQPFVFEYDGKQFKWKKNK